MNKVELLAPAGDLERLKIAVLYGANAVFVGGKQFSLRAKANNFTLKDLKEAVLFANQHQAKVHVTVNIVPYDDDFDELDSYLLSLNQIGVHAIIVSSIYVVRRAKELKCSFEVHISTQQSIANSKAIEFYKECGADRVVLAREVNIEAIETIKKKTVLPLEVFIHGGMCSSFSGRCTLSNVMANRDANKGGCAHSCRWTYHLYENNQRVSNEKCIIASRDLMSVDYIPKLLDLGIDSFKIEGRMKSIHYIATVVSSYRHLIDEYMRHNKIEKKRLNEYKVEIGKAENRITYTGFFNKEMLGQALLENVGEENPTQSFLALIIKEKDDTGATIIEVRNYFTTKDIIEYIQSDGKKGILHLEKMTTMEDEIIDIANHPKQQLKLYCKENLTMYTLLRKG